MKIIDEISSKIHLSEVGHGKKEVQMAYIDGKTGHTITPFCRCKDYFNDMFFSNKVKKPIKIFGFGWTPNQDKGVLDRNVLTMAVRLRDKNDHNVIFDITEKERKSVYDLLSKISKANNLGRIIVRICEDKKNLIIYFNKKWTDIPYLNSALYFFVRLGFTYEKDKDVLTWYDKSDKFISPNDQNYFKSSNTRIKDLLEGRIDSNQKYEYYNEGNIHNNSGLVCYSGYKIS